MENRKSEMGVMFRGLRKDREVGQNEAILYFDVIKAPTDMSTMDAKLESGQYKDSSVFKADFGLTTNEAKTYNMAICPFDQAIRHCIHSGAVEAPTRDDPPL
ncbi:hypothetical protein TRAPUB_13668 [Trametes pubescens]|uniref:Bromo domain-containing protein n=1 Tax=Trametes pubescens TaxID=154538 RepID=A0A1M2VQK8_TRAPU|nr:hypothetical protein TRAPUB_13668 [Trametes pubescens]